MPQSIRTARTKPSKLRERLAEMEETLQAIRNGEVDAVVVQGSQGPRIFTLQTGDLPYRELLEQMSEGAASISEGGLLLFCNSRLAEMAGYPLEKLIGAKVDELIASSERSDFDNLFSRALKGAEKEEIQLQRPDGTLVPIQISLRCVDTGHGRNICMVATDVAELKNRSRAKMRRLAAVVESCDQAMIAVTADGKITDWNQGATRLFGYCPGEIIGRSFDVLLPAGSRSEYQAVLERMLRGEVIAPYESQRIAKDGSVCDVSVIDSAIRDDEAHITGYSSIATDIREAKSARDKIALQSAALEATANAVAITDVNGTIEWVNPAFTALTGYALEEALGRNPRELVRSGAHDQAFYQELWTTILAGQAWSGEIINCRKNGERYTEEMTIAPVRSRDGKIEHFIAIKQDISDRKAKDSALRVAEEQYRAIFENANIGIFLTTADGRPLIINQALAEMHGYQNPEQLLAEISNVPRQLFVNSERFGSFAPILEAEGQVRGAEIEVIRRDGSQRTLLANVRAIRDANGSIAQHEGTLIDITERKIAEERAHFLAYYDPLTGLANRTLFQDRLKQAMAGARRTKNRIAVAFLDLDRFKDINDWLGHTTGDQLLRQIAQALSSCVREECTIGRIGGDEFLILMKIKGLEDAVRILKRVLEAMQREFIVSGIPLHVTCSIGVSLFPDNGEDVETLIKNADTAMYVAKDTGRDKFQFFDPEMNAKVVERMWLENNLRIALEQDQFFLLYQPQVDVAAERVVGVEALLRWQHPDMGLISPSRFIPIAESSGLIVPIGDWVLRNACAQMRQWQKSGVPVGRVAVNVSAAELRTKSYLGRLKKIIEETGISPHCLEVEITESLLVADIPLTRQLLCGLRNLNLSLAIDDFGTGYSNLKYLKDYGVTKLKIDRSFIRDIGQRPESAVILRAIIHMAKNLGMEVVAEGVETRRQWKFLKRNQCDQVQGFCFSKPLSATEVSELLHAQELTVSHRG